MPTIPKRRDDSGNILLSDSSPQHTGTNRNGNAEEFSGRSPPARKKVVNGNPAIIAPSLKKIVSFEFETANE